MKAVVGKPAAAVMTSSPGWSAHAPRLGEVSAVNASRLALDPELQVSTCGTPKMPARRFSKASLKRPVVSQPSSAASTRLTNSLCAQLFQGDLVADFFCGSGTTLAVARRLGRKWLGADAGTAVHSARKRLLVQSAELPEVSSPFVVLACMPGDASDGALIRAIIGIARDLSLQTVAEGVESEVQLEILQELGCTPRRGLPFSRPVPAARMGELLHGSKQA